MEPYIETLKTEYLPGRGGSHAKQGAEYCWGSKRDTAHFAEDGAICLRWGTEPDAAALNKMRSLHLVPNSRDLRSNAIPAFIRKAKHLEFLGMPASFALGLEPNNLPSSLTSLMLINSTGCYELLEKAGGEWPEGVVLPKLRALQFFTMAGGKPLDSLLGISPAKLPALEYLECDIHGATAKLETIGSFASLKFLAVQDVGALDIFKYLHRSLVALSIVATKPAFPINELTSVASIELLWLNGLGSPVDCSLFTDLPKLKELNFLNCRKMSNVAALLKCKRLESLEVRICGKPFDKQTKELFKAHGFKRLGIDFA